MARTSTAKRSTDNVILGFLIYEFDCDEPRETDRKIKRAMRYHGCGPYDQTRVELQRSMKNWAMREIVSESGSRHYRSATRDQPMPFDVEALVDDVAGRYPDIPRTEIADFIPHAIYFYCLR